jgi:hypothetical protein
MDKELPDLKTLKAADLLSAMWGTMGALPHKDGCSKQETCTCGLEQLRKDITDLMKKLGDSNGEKR